MQIEREEWLERYLGGQLTEAEQERVEEHYFACARCYERFEVLQAAAAELRATATREELPDHASSTASRLRRWLPLVAGAMAAALALAWLVPSRKPPAPAAATTAALPSPDARLSELAKLEPPAYRAVALRGASDAADKRFRAAMKSYQGKDYAAAATGLQAAQNLAPDRADIAFFLGASEMMRGNTEAALRQLGKTVAFGDTPFLEDAHFYMAKIYLQNSDPKAAMAELEQTIRLKGERAEAAERLRQQLAALGIR